MQVLEIRARIIPARQWRVHVQSLVEPVLDGKRLFNLRQVRRLAEGFQVPMDGFARLRTNS
ncbi:hypothetical protein [Pseudomonas fluorescens]|uniref:hypothetical protein n=1 Tax=Pseudomonas fluorescens TaxID=294 RepID=UPI000641DEE3|nr:hypothetical protein [Pseudomonas fluorescens]